MSEGEDQENKTESPTQKRLEEAVKKGNVPFSREITSFLMLGMLALTIAWLAPGIMHKTGVLLRPFIADFSDLPTDPAGLGGLMLQTFIMAMAIIALPLVGAMVCAVAASLLQNGVIISAEPMMPKLSKISPMAGFKRIVSMRSLVEFIKGIIKIIVVGMVGYLSIKSELVHLQQLPGSTMHATLWYMGKIAAHLVLAIVIAMFFIAMLDFLYQRFQYTKSLRMSKQEIRDEYKQSEGDPHIKAKLRRLRQERARTRMMAAVPGADVVITNPTHFAVALKYDTKAMKAPTVVAKGQDLMAFRIREVAEENDVPVVQNPPLARALFASTDIDDEISSEHYEAVAKVISYVYQLKGKKS